MRNTVLFWTFLAFVPALWGHSNLIITGIVDSTPAHLPRATGLRRKTSRRCSIAPGSSQRPQVSVRLCRNNREPQSRSCLRSGQSRDKRSSL